MTPEQFYHRNFRLLGLKMTKRKLLTDRLVGLTLIAFTTILMLFGEPVYLEEPSVPQFGTLNWFAVLSLIVSILMLLYISCGKSGEACEVPKT